MDWREFLTATAVRGQPSAGFTIARGPRPSAIPPHPAARPNGAPRDGAGTRRLHGAQSVKTALPDQTFAEMNAQKDPRAFARGYVFDEYPYADDSGRNSHQRYMRGEKLRAGWVNPTDFENTRLD